MIDFTLTEERPHAGFELAELAFDLPGEVHRALETVATSGLQIHLPSAELEPLVARTERVGNRVVGSVLLLACVGMYVARRNAK